MKKRLCIVLIVLFALLLVPHAASANSPGPSSLRVHIYYSDVAEGAVFTVFLAGEDGVFRSRGSERPTEKKSGDFTFYRYYEDTQLYLECTVPDGAVTRSNTVSLREYAKYSYNGTTNVLEDRTDEFSFGESCESCGNCALFGGVLLLSIMIPFGITLLIEFLVALCFRLKPRRYVIFANLITNIPMNIVMLIISFFTVGSGAVYWITLAVLELIVCGFEFWFYTRKYKDRKIGLLLAFTLVANALSAAAGILVNRFFL